MKQVLKILLAVAAGKTQIFDLGNGEATVVFKNQADNVDRISASMINSERVEVILDDS